MYVLQENIKKETYKKAKKNMFTIVILVRNSVNV